MSRVPDPALPSYRDDPGVPAFPDDLPVIVFDGVCGMCSRLVRFLLWVDSDAMRHRFVAAQSPLGEALYRHYGIDPRGYDTLLVLAAGRCRVKADGVLTLLAGLGLPWSGLARIGRLLPIRRLDAGYDLVAQNRYRIWGRFDACQRPPPGAESRFLR